MSGPFFAPVRKRPPADGLITNGLIERWAMNEGEGLIAHGEINSLDLTLDGIITAKPEWVNDRNAQCCAIENFGASAGTYLWTMDNPLLNFGTGDFSICLWFLNTVETANNNAQNIVLKASGTSPFEGYVLRTRRNAATGTLNKLNFLPYGTGGNQIHGTTHILENVWYHAIAERAGGEIRLFVDAVDEGVVENNNVDVDNTEPFTVGAIQTGWSGTRFEGKVDDLRLYNRGLTQDEKNKIVAGTG